MVFPRLEVKAEVGGEEGGAKFGNQFLACIARIAVALPAQIAVEPRRMPGPVRLMPISA